jgi:hypothetical protein
VHPEGALFGKSHEYCVTLMFHVRVTAVVPTTLEPNWNMRSLQLALLSKYTENGGGKCKCLIRNDENFQDENLISSLGSVIQLP